MKNNELLKAINTTIKKISISKLALSIINRVGGENKINVNNASTVIAVKVSSSVTIEYLNIKKTIKCIHVYRKKQEFSGAIANLKFVKCHDGKIEKQAGSFINKNTL